MRKKSYIKKRKRRNNMIIRGICLAVFIVIGTAGIYFGTQARTLDEGYEIEARKATITFGADLSRSEGYTEDICVITDETPFQNEDIGSASAASIFNVTDRTVLFSKNGLERLYPASMTKIMTALLVLKYGNLEDMVTVTEDAVITESGATLCGIKPGDTISMQDLLYGLMMPSGNDAGNAIAVHMYGSVEAFAEQMNAEARALGATKTHFMNPHGLHHEDHYTTAYDLYLIFNELLNYDKFLDVISTPTYTAQYKDANGAPVSQVWNNSNWYMTGKTETPAGVAVMGGKTGTTNAAGYCLIMLSRDAADKRYISVVFKAENRNAMYTQMTNLLTKIVN